MNAVLLLFLFSILHCGCSSGAINEGTTCLLVSHGQECSDADAVIISDQSDIGTCTCNLTEVNDQLIKQQDEIDSIKEVLNRLCNPEKPGTSVVPAEKGWYTPGNCYQYQQTIEALSWEESRRICQEKGGDIAAPGIRNLTMRDSITDAILGDRLTWIGLNDIEHEGTFFWIDGVAATDENTRWETAEPNDSASNEDCGELNYPDHARYTVNDNACQKNRLALCEKPLLPFHPNY